MKKHRVNLGQAVRFSIFEELENRRLFSAAVESIDGTGNNLLHTTWGSTNTDLLRNAAAAYGTNACNGVSIEGADGLRLKIQ